MNTQSNAQVEAQALFHSVTGMNFSIPLLDTEDLISDAKKAQASDIYVSGFISAGLIVVVGSETHLVPWIEKEKDANVLVSELKKMAVSGRKGFLKLV